MRKSQISKHKFQVYMDKASICDLNIGKCDLFVIWCLELVISRLGGNP
jgi:hypothetical protein